MGCLWVYLINKKPLVPVPLHSPTALSAYNKATLPKSECKHVDLEMKGNDLICDWDDFASDQPVESLVFVVQMCEMLK